MNMCDFRSAVHIHYDLNSSLSSFSISTFHSTFGFFHLKVNFFSVRVSEFPQECLFLFLFAWKGKDILSITYIDRTNIIPSSSDSDIFREKELLCVLKCNQCISYVLLFDKIKSLRLEFQIYFRYILLERRKYLLNHFKHFCTTILY